MLMINSGFSKREPVEACTWTQIKVNISAYHHQHHQAPITYHVQLNFHHFHFVRHLRPDDNDHRVLLVRSVGDSLTNVGEALHPASRWGDIFIFYIFIFSYLHPASRWGDFFIFYIFIFSYLHPASRWGIENQNCFSYRTAKKTISSGQGAQLPLLKSLVHRRLYGRTWLLHGSPWAKVLT